MIQTLILLLATFAVSQAQASGRLHVNCKYDPESLAVVDLQLIQNGKALASGFEMFIPMQIVHPDTRLRDALCKVEYLFGGGPGVHANLECQQSPNGRIFHYKLSLQNEGAGYNIQFNTYANNSNQKVSSLIKDIDVKDAKCEMRSL